MAPNLPSFEQSPVDAEMDLLERGGVQRFPTIASIDAWIAEEETFWQWLRHGNASQIFMGESQEQWNQFWSYKETIASQKNVAVQQWNRLAEAIRETQSAIPDDAGDEALGIFAQVKEMTDNANKIARDYANGAVAILKSHIESWYHVSRLEPVAQFISEMAKDQPGAAAFALDHVISNGRKNHSRKEEEFIGRLAASLFSQNLSEANEANNSAFAEATAMWSRELADYKKRFDELSESYKQLEESCKTTDQDWKNHEFAMKDADETRLADFEKSLKDRLGENATQMESLTHTYETHMQLKGPLVYWKKKQKGHDDSVKRLRKWLVVSCGAGLAMIWLAAVELLPANYPQGTVPWRPIALFLIVSTFVIWFIKLLIKIFLSNVHLAADASERVVMISTFMALQRKRAEDSAPLDLGIIMSSIFRPSTTGVITEDGGPVTVMDMLSKLSGGKG